MVFRFYAFLRYADKYGILITINTFNRMDKFTEGNKMAAEENSKDLISVLWSGADILRSKMDANIKIICWESCFTSICQIHF